MKSSICIVLQKLVALVWKYWVFIRSRIGFVPIFRRNLLLLSSGRSSETSVQTHFTTRCKRTGITVHDGVYDRRYWSLQPWEPKALLFADMWPSVCIQLARNCVINYLCRSQWPCGLRRESAAARLLGLRFRIPSGALMSLCWECCVLWPLVGLIPRTEESSRVWCVWVWSWSLDNEKPLAH